MSKTNVEGLYRGVDMSSILNQSAEKMSLLQLLDSIDEFVVPIIQRDYAQGRNEGSQKALCEDIRNDLVTNLSKALINEEKYLLNYIYGAKISNIFYPIDGQQRLTTLFLLYMCSPS